MLLKIGTRGSLLALTQTLKVKYLLNYYFPNIKVEIIKIKTSGDIFQNQSLADIGGKGLFIKEIEGCLLDRAIDIAVHSMKDVPAFYNDNFIIPCILKRDSPYDAFISLKYRKFNHLPHNAIIGTSSIRRKVQLLNIRPDLKIIPLRGNITTRLEKLKNGNSNLDAIILAEAGLRRIKKHHFITEVLPTNIMISAVGQGAICIQCLKDNYNIQKIIKKLNDINTFTSINIERSFMKAVNGSCNTPLAAFAKYIDDDRIILKCMLADDQRIFITKNICNKKDGINIAWERGVELKKKLKE